MRKTLICLAVMIFCASCRGRIPDPVNHEYSEQRKIEATHHWDVLAYDVANRVNQQLLAHDYLETPVYVKRTCGSEDRPCAPQETSTFDEAFRDLLITEMVNIGIPVAPAPNDETITVHYKVQLVYHRAKRVRPIRPGLMTTLAAGVVVFRNIPSEVVTIAAAGLADLANQEFTTAQHFEILITTSMIAEDRYLLRTSDIYYINDEDSYQYQTKLPVTETVTFIGPKKNTPKKNKLTDVTATTKGSVTPETTDKTIH